MLKIDRKSMQFLQENKLGDFTQILCSLSFEKLPLSSLKNVRQDVKSFWKHFCFNEAIEATRQRPKNFSSIDWFRHFEIRSKKYAKTIPQTEIVMESKAHARRLFNVRSAQKWFLLN